jgi:release factor glutamine methyltransferase
MKLKEVLDKSTQFFKDKKIDSAHALKIERIQLYVKFDQPLSEDELVTCREMVRRRIQGEPVAYILEHKHFYGASFKVSPAVLIPRPETEHLVESALQWAEENPSESYNILDLGTGSGCIGLTLLKKIPKARLIAVDISEKALEIAADNAKALEVLDRVEFVLADASRLDRPLPKIDILVSNPPYIAADDKDVEPNVKKFEPEIALFAKDQGLDFLYQWSSKYAPFLNNKSIVLMEMGMNQSSEMKKHFEQLNVFSKVDVIKDLARLDRIIRGVKNG